MLKEKQFPPSPIPHHNAKPLGPTLPSHFLPFVLLKSFVICHYYYFRLLPIEILRLRSKKFAHNFQSSRTTSRLNNVNIRSFNSLLLLLSPLDSLTRQFFFVLPLFGLVILTNTTTILGWRAYVDSRNQSPNSLFVVKGKNGKACTTKT